MCALQTHSAKFILAITAISADTENTLKSAFVGKIWEACSQCSDILRVAKLLRYSQKGKFV